MTDTLPFNRASETSWEAAESMREHAPTDAERVFRFIEYSGDVGMTCDAIEVASGMSHQSCSARVNQLANEKRVVRTEIKRQTRSGRNAYVYVVAS